MKSCTHLSDTQQRGCSILIMPSTQEVHAWIYNYIHTEELQRSHFKRIPTPQLWQRDKEVKERCVWLLPCLVMEFKADQKKPFQAPVMTTPCRQRGTHYANSRSFPLFPVWKKKMQKPAWLSPRHSLCHLCGLHMFMQMEEHLLYLNRFTSRELIIEICNMLF